MEVRICKTCGIEKPIDDFRKTLHKKNNKYYYRNKCRKCENEENLVKSKEYYQKHKKEINKRNYERCKNNENYIKYRKEYYKKYKELHKNEISARRKERYKNNIEKEREYKKKYYYTHQEQIKAQDKIYYQRNKKTILQKQREKRKNDSKFKVKKQIRTMIWNSFNRNGHTKKKKSEKILGCSLDYFYNYLLQTFKENYGYEWDKIEPVHIDHIKPISLATTEEEVIKLCHYTNLQLLKAHDNLQKSNKVNWELT